MMETILAGTISNREGQVVGQVLAKPNLETYKLDLSVHINGSKGKQIAQALQEVRLSVSPELPADVYVHSSADPFDRHRSVSLNSLLRVMSDGELTLAFEPRAVGSFEEDMDHPNFGLLHDAELELRMKKFDLGLARSVPLEEFLAELEAMPEYLESPFRGMIDEFESNPEAPGIDWLERFKEALAHCS